LLCFEVRVPAGAQTFRATTSGGRGESDLIVAYHKPDFRLAVSDGFGNDENVSLTSPNPGKWYVGVSGWLDFSGVMLRMSVDLPIAPTASFSASPTTGVVPLSVQFSDASSGSIGEWLWEFGDGETSTQRNPRHSYTEPGRYDVTLRVTGPGGTKSLKQAEAIRVNPAITLMPILDLILDDDQATP
jgi:PKD repeat protein